MTIQMALRLEASVVDDLDRLVIDFDDLKNRSDAVRQAVEEFIERRQRELIDREIVDAYTRHPQGDFDVDDWGDLSGQTTRTAVATHRMQNVDDGGWNDATR